MSSPVPEGWAVLTLGEISAVKGGKRLPKGSSFSPVKTKYPYIRVSDFDAGTISRKELRYVDEVTRNAIKRYVISAEDLYISIAGTIGIIGSVPKELDGALLTENAAKIVFNDKTSSDKEFYKYLLLGNEAQEHFNQSKGTGGGVPKLALFRIEDTPTVLPPLPEQQKIAAILSTVDDVIEKTRAQIDKLKDLKTGMMQELLTKGIGPGGVPHTEFKDSPVGRIPVGWDVCELVDYLSYISYGFTNPMPESDDGPFMITAKDVTELAVQYSNARQTTKEAFDNLLTEKSRPKVNDILLTKDGTLGRVALVDREGICINQSVAVLRPNEKVEPKFLLYLLAAPPYQREMLDKAGGSTIKHIYITVVDKMKVAVPSLEEQARIVAVLDSLFGRMALCQSKLDQYLKIKKALMQDLLTGKVRVNVDNKESAVA